MLNTLRKHWYFLALTAGAIAAATYLIVSPPVLIVTAALILSSSPFFAALGTVAATAALATVAATAALAVFTLGAIARAVVSTLFWGARGLVNLLSRHKGPVNDGEEEDKHGAIARSYQQILGQPPIPGLRSNGSPSEYAGAAPVATTSQFRATALKFAPGAPASYASDTESSFDLTGSPKRRPSPAFFPIGVAAENDQPEFDAPLILSRI